jgi:protease-4
MTAAAAARASEVSGARPAAASSAARCALRPALALCLVLASLASAGCVTVDVLGRRRPLEETVVREGRGPKILLVEIEGQITENEGRRVLGRAEESTVARVREVLDHARERGDVKALLLRIDTPGGGVTASEILYREIERFKTEQKVPVVAQLMGLATSGGYFVAMAADHLVAYPTTVTGSIGVVFLNVNLSRLLERWGVVDETVVSGPRKDAGSPLRPMVPEERAQFQSVVDDLFARFLAVVRAGRPRIDPEKLAEAADGRIVSAQQALQLGLIDEIGGLDESVAAIERETGLRDMRVVTYHRPEEWRENWFARGPSAPTVQVDLGALAGVLGEPGFQYLWWPGVGR